MTQSPMQRKHSMTITVSNNSVSGIVPAATREISDDKDTSPVVKVFISSGGKTVSHRGKVILLSHM